MRGKTFQEEKFSQAKLIQQTNACNDLALELDRTAVLMYRENLRKILQFVEDNAAFLESETFKLYNRFNEYKNMGSYMLNKMRKDAFEFQVELNLPSYAEWKKKFFSGDRLLEDEELRRWEQFYIQDFKNILNYWDTVEQHYQDLSSYLLEKPKKRKNVATPGTKPIYKYKCYSCQCNVKETDLYCYRCGQKLSVDQFIDIEERKKSNE